ncbi:MAG TPA: Asp-tRNA(Asn)/Glu-tRNA(Gln) amidotransferase subunit GatB, partial [Bacillota bacterium]
MSARSVATEAQTPYETVVGLEVHVELKTESKIFCGCAATFGAEPNSRVCPICLGLPGVLPVLNARALEQAVRAALALNCRIHRRSKFDRKNYHYPDLPKGYQISQYDLPLGYDGAIEIDQPDGGTRRIRIRRVHLEEDTGKSLHDQLPGASVLDFNRAGVPLLEIVSEPDLRSAAEARAYLEELRLIMAYTGVSDVRMEEGSLRVDCNVSVRPRGSDVKGTITEIKNLNSFRSVVRAITYEAERQWQVLVNGGTLTRETRHW